VNRSMYCHEIILKLKFYMTKSLQEFENYVKRSKVMVSGYEKVKIVLGAVLSSSQLASGSIFRQSGTKVKSIRIRCQYIYFLRQKYAPLIEISAILELQLP